jgi:hypothetical protein
MPRRKERVGREHELRALADDPPAQTALALQILARDRDTLNLRAALAVLQAHPAGRAREPLLDLFAYYMADGVRRDAGTYLRAAILQALRLIATLDDLPVLEKAAATYEFLPPGRSEEAAILRSTALVLINELDDKLGALHCVRLLADQHTSALSGEPALTAVRVLWASERLEPLYYYALHQTAPQSDVLSECLRSLSQIPEALRQELVEKYGATDDEVVLVGLLDMVLDGGGGNAFIASFLSQTQHLAVYRYLVTRLVAAHQEPWLAELEHQSVREADSAKLKILEDALALGRDDPTIHRALAAVRRRRLVAAKTPRAKNDG